ncbi:unnamed protein product [Rhizophagus irregularis]|uniref:Cytochrome P450 n=1 Tax=Rhizophagus irregularis TaxID=588596 RepID=A0A2I1G801_9GLOM|nr:cytochrome P450 [Rhizophagus irregularis]CAB4440115.1 unnamed protein product [Rhizophagus irregularis]
MISIITSIFIILLGILLYLIIKYPDRSIGTNARPDLTGPKGLPLIGNLFKIREKGLTKFMYDVLMIYGPIATFTFPGLGRFITINDPESIEYVMKTNFDNYIKTPGSRIRLLDLLGDGIFNVNGQMWKFQRKLASHLFYGKNFREIICVVFEEETKKFLKIMEKKVNSGEIFDLQELFYRFTLNSFGRITFGLDFDCLTNIKNPVKFAVAFDLAQTITNKRVTNPYLWRCNEMFTDEGNKIREACKYLSDFAYDIIRKRRSNPEYLKNPKDILNLFMNAEYENGEKLTDKELKDIIINLIIAGRDTTAQELAWMMYNVMVNPNVEGKLVEEVNSLLSENNPIPKYDDIKQFEYTQATFYETLRLHPAVPISIKLCLKDDMLPNGTPIYAGELVNWSSWATGRDERIWGENAKIFSPERFLNSEDGLKPSQYKFTSFNCGPRLCLGQNFATIEAMTLATSLLRIYKFERIPGQKSPPDFGVSITLPMKDPLLVKVHRRN